MSWWVNRAKQILDEDIFHFCYLVWSVTYTDQFYLRRDFSRIPPVPSNDVSWQNLAAINLPGIDFLWLSIYGWIECFPRKYDEYRRLLKYASEWPRRGESAKLVISLNTVTCCLISHIRRGLVAFANNHLFLNTSISPASMFLASA